VSGQPDAGRLRLEALLREKSSEVERLSARVAGLERRLADRSRLIRRLAREICDDDVLVMSWLAAGSRPPIGGNAGLRRWVETTELTAADVETTMKELWRREAPRAGDEEP
jgi:hypothetical protein